MLSSIFYPIFCSSFLNSKSFSFNLGKELQKEAVIYYSYMDSALALLLQLLMC